MGLFSAARPAPGHGGHAGGSSAGAGLGLSLSLSAPTSPIRTPPPPRSPSSSSSAGRPASSTADHAHSPPPPGWRQPAAGEQPPAPLRRTQSTEPSKRTAHILGIPYSNVEHHYVLGRQLGTGMAGVIRHCIDRRTGESYACKTLSKSRMLSAADLEEVHSEVRAHRKVSSHPAVASLRAVIEDDQNVHLIMELCEGGDLFDRVQQKKHYPEKEAARLCRILLSVVDYCHSHGIMHRDLKPENVLMTSMNSDTAVKVVDFGQAVFFEPGVKLTQAVGTPYYIAPEVLNRSYGPEADAWSLGVILYILLCGVPPFWGENREGIFTKIRAGVFDLEGGPWRHISNEAKDLVRRMLCIDPARRITPVEAKAHPWIQLHCGSQSSIPLNQPIPTADEARDSRGAAEIPLSPDLGASHVRIHTGNNLKKIQTRCDGSPTSFREAQAHGRSPHSASQGPSADSQTGGSSATTPKGPAGSPQASTLRTASGVPPKSPPRKSVSAFSAPSVRSRDVQGSTQMTRSAAQEWSLSQGSIGSSPDVSKGALKGGQTPPRLGSSTPADILAAVAEKLKLAEEASSSGSLWGEGQHLVYVVDLKDGQAVVEYNQQEQRIGINFREPVRTI